MPIIFQSIPPQKTIDPRVSIPIVYQAILPMLSNYRRIMEYFRMLASRPDLLRRGLATGPIEKCLHAIDDCETLFVQICGDLERNDADRPALNTILNKCICSARSMLDLEIRKHADQTGIGMLKLTEDGFELNVDALELGGLKGNWAAFFLAAETDPSIATSPSIKVEFFERDGKAAKIWQVPMMAGGLNPIAVDFLIGNISNQARIALSDGRNELVIPVRCSVTESSMLSASIIDEESGQFIPCRVRLTDAYGKFYAPTGVWITTIPREWPGENWSTNFRYSDQQFFYCSGRFHVELPPGKYSMLSVRGFEYEVKESFIEIIPSEIKQIEIPMKRHLDMPALGWHSGQTHIHSQNMMPVNDHSGWEIIPDAEGLEVSFLSIFHQNEEIFTEEYPIGPIRHFSRNDYYLMVGEEFRHVPYGHMTFLNLKEVVPPISSGRLGGKNWADTPCNAQAIDIAHKQGAVAVYCHFDARGPIVINDELPIDAALGKVDCGEVMGAGGGYKYWYPMLNCGIRIGACAGPDWNIEDCCRVYVYTGNSDFTFEGWMDALRAQRTFVSSGPMLFFAVNGQIPGSVIRGENAQSISILGKVSSTMSVRKLEIIVNGEIFDRIESAGDTRELCIQKDFKPDRNCWIALRCFGQGAAHTSPVYVELNDEPMGRPEDARELLAISEQCLGWTEKNGIFNSDPEREEVLAMFRKGTDFYRNIVNDLR